VEDGLIGEELDTVVGVSFVTGLSEVGVLPEGGAIRLASLLVRLFFGR
jgi:hypothetical protein